MVKHLRIRTWPLTACLLAIAACGDLPRGVIITDDGQTISSTAENFRAYTARGIVKQLNEQLGGHWLSEVTISEQPTFDSEKGAWYWEAATVQVNAIGDGTVACPHPAEDLKLAVVKRLSSSVERPHTNLRVFVAAFVDARRFAQLSAPPAPVPAATPVPAPVAAPVAVAPAPKPAPVAKPAPAPVATTDVPVRNADGEPIVTVAPAEVRIPDGGTAPPQARPAAPAKPLPPTAEQHYTVQADDTLASISAVFYGSTRYWRKIIQANPGLEPESLKVGMVLVIPPIEETVR